MDYNEIIKNIDLDEIGKDIDNKEFRRLYWDLIVPEKQRFLIILFMIIILNQSFFTSFIFEEKLRLILKFCLNLLSVTQNIFLVLLAILVTGFSIFQALLSKNNKIFLCFSTKDGSSLFRRYNFYFYSLGISYVAIIFFNFICLVFFSEEYNLKILVERYPILFKRYSLLIAINMYIFIVVSLILDLKSFLKNLYSTFQNNIYFDIIEVKKENEDSNN